jgi:succinate dehydrogenase / fumarate reductase cytochrome b subunit
VKVAYWPGCVSRGFTPELHGSMAKVAPLLDIEMIGLLHEADLLPDSYGG